MPKNYTTIRGLFSKFDEFLAVRSQFDSDHGVDFYAPTCCQSATFISIPLIPACTARPGLPLSPPEIAFL